MKNLLHLLLLFIAIQTIQAQSFNWSGIVNNNDGSPLENTNVQLAFGLYDGAAINANIVYSETHNVTTNAQGFVSAVVGEGTATQGVFMNLDWSKTFTFQVDINTPQEGWEILGSETFKSVPVANSAITAKGLKKDSHGISIDEVSNRIVFFTNNGGTMYLEGNQLRLAGLSGSEPELLEVSETGVLRRKTPKTKYYSISGRAFLQNGFNYNFIQGLWNNSGIETNTELYYPLNLPHGCTVKRIRVYYTDNVSQGLRIRIERFNQNGFFAPSISNALNTNDFSQSASWQSQQSTIIDTFINNQQNTYQLKISTIDGAWPSTNSLAIRSIVIEYED